MVEGLAIRFATGVSVTVSFVCLYGRPNIHDGRSAVAYSSFCPFGKVLRFLLAHTMLGSNYSGSVEEL